jgi:hypothetical protein
MTPMTGTFVLLDDIERNGRHGVAATTMTHVVPTRKSCIPDRRTLTTCGDFGPYGTRAVSPK